MAQSEAQVPDPLRHNEPELLTPGAVRTPAVRVLFVILIRQHGLKRPAMQVQGYHISRRKSLHRQGREEELVDVLTPRGADGSGGSGRRMGGDDHPDARPCRAQRQIRTIKEGARGSGFRMGGLLIGGPGQASLP